MYTCQFDVIKTSIVARPSLSFCCICKTKSKHGKYHTCQILAASPHFMLYLFIYNCIRILQHMYPYTISKKDFLAMFLNLDPCHDYIQNCFNLRNKVCSIFLCANLLIYIHYQSIQEISSTILESTLSCLLHKLESFIVFPNMNKNTSMPSTGIETFRILFQDEIYDIN